MAWLDRFSLAFKFNVLVLLSGLVFLGSYLMLSRGLTPISDLWSEYQDQVVARNTKMTGIKRLLGFGGLIHNQKDFILRRDERYFTAADQSAKEAMQLLGAYTNIEGLSQKEHAAADELKKVVAAYQEGLVMIEALHQTQIPSAIIDRLIIVDDRPALEAFAEMEAAYLGKTKDLGTRLTKRIRLALNQLAVSLALGFLAIAVFCTLLRFAVVGGINHVVVLLKDLAEGEGDLTPVMAERQDTEIGRLGWWINRFLENLRALVGNIRQNARDLNHAGNQLSASASQLSSGSRQMLATSNAVADNMNKVNHNLEAIAGTTEEFDQVVHLIAGAAQEITATTDAVQDSARTVRGLASDAGDAGRHGRARVAEMEQSAEEIELVTLLIRDIAEQTKLLALNATIEAARAGEAGRGFSVVAGEIKQLSSQSTEAAGQISAQIETVQSRASEAGSASEETSKALTNVNEAMHTIEGSIAEQATATAQITKQIHDVRHGADTLNQSIRQISQKSQEVSEKMNQAGRVAQESADNVVMIDEEIQRLLGVSERLRALVEKFKIDETTPTDASL
ncbi:methyl-accepting chemotaxis protein [Acanthopleuribacter pedis]|uniref:Methyl-accepting chemotaxis protein n=1 Tax=Acanthopleuribacter pedis TaxID=442870 RepID=A0A8J7Q4J5_9BACT|nr:methyl-accepting chemotaxis protein [Acanthopleuribacter pedis]MBO1320467.1 methyl-accepting chemotaxis protein [Acanthopleuribacter pedis]